MYLLIKKCLINEDVEMLIKKIICFFSFEVVFEDIECGELFFVIVLL